MGEKHILGELDNIIIWFTKDSEVYYIENI